MLGRVKATDSPSHLSADAANKYYAVDTLRVGCFGLFCDTSFNSQHWNISPSVNIPLPLAEVKFLLPSIRMEQGKGKVKFTLE